MAHSLVCLNLGLIPHDRCSSSSHRTQAGGKDRQEGQAGGSGSRLTQNPVGNAISTMCLPWLWYRLDSEVETSH